MASKADDDTRADEYDSPWKEVVEAFFPDMLALLFPKIHAEIEWSRGWESLDKDLIKLLPDSEAGNRWADKLFRVYRQRARWEWLFNKGSVESDERLVHLHVEIQNQFAGDLELRVFTTNYRVFDRYQEPVVSLVVLGDDRPKWRPWRFGWKLWGCEAGIRFPSVKLIDYNRRKLERMAETKPFAIVVLAQLEAQATSKTPDGRLRAKFGLIRRLYESGYDRGKIKALFRFIDWVMWLPETYKEKLDEGLEQLETEKKMQYVTSWERKGIKKGRQEGLLLGKAALLKRLLVRRFGELPEWAERRLADADSDDLDRWGESLLEAKNLASVFTGPDAQA